MNPRRTVVLLPAVTLLGLLGACAGGGSSSAATTEVKAGDSSCEVADTELHSGTTKFTVENVGSEVTEVYVYGRSGDGFTKIMGEKENIGPGTSQSFQVDLTAGKYQVACKPGMKGDGIRTDVTVTGSGGKTAMSEDEGAGYDRELEFAVAPSGQVKPPSGAEATAGERVEFKLENEAKSEYYLEVLGPDGAELGKAEAPAGQQAEFVAKLATAGTYQVKVFEDGQEAAGSVVKVTVRK